MFPKSFTFPASSAPLPLTKEKTIPTHRMKDFPTSVENLASLIPLKTVVSLIGNGLYWHPNFVLFCFPGEILVRLCVMLVMDGQTP